MGMSLAMWLDYNALVPTEGRSDVIKKLALLAGALCFPVSIAYSRLFLGVHSLNQVIWGLQMGLWVALTCHFLIRDPLMDLIQRLIDAKERQNTTKLFLGSSAILVGLISVQIINYQAMLGFENDP